MRMSGNGNGANLFSLTATNGANSNVTNYRLNVFVPTAASVSIGGRVFDGNARGLANALVSLTDTNGATRTARTNSFGYDRFDRITAGQSFIVSISAKRYQFAPQVVSVVENLTELNFIAEP